MRSTVLWAVCLVATSSCGGDAFSSGNGGSGGSSGEGGNESQAGDDGAGDSGVAGRAGSAGSSASGGAGRAGGGDAGSGADDSGGDAGRTGSDAGEGGEAATGGATAGSGGGSSGAQNGGSSGSGASAGGGGRPVFTELLAEGFVRTQANAVSGDGFYVAGQATRVTGHIRPIRWKDATALVLGDELAWNGAYGQGISDDGTVVAGSIDTAVSAEAFRWEGTLEPLPPLVRGDAFAQAVGLSGDGRVAIGISRAEEGADAVAVQWLSGGVQQLPVLDGQLGAEPTSIDHDGGFIVGTGVVEADGSYQAVAWPASGVFSLGLPNSEVFAVSADGHYAVGGFIDPNGSGPRVRSAFRWSADGVDIFPGIGTAADCKAVAVSGDGSLVAVHCVETIEQTYVHHWLLWQDSDVVELDQLLRILDVDPSLYDEWEITDISRDGTAIIGNTRKQGVGMGWRAYIDGLER